MSAGSWWLPTRHILIPDTFAPNDIPTRGGVTYRYPFPFFRLSPPPLRFDPGDGARKRGNGLPSNRTGRGYE